LRILIGIATALCLIVAILRLTPRPADTTPEWVFATDARDIDYCDLPVLDGSGPTADEIPKAYTPGCGFTQFPRPVLASCTEPLSPGSADLRGLWRSYSGREGHVEHIEQCGNRLIVNSSTVIHDFRTDGSLANGNNDVEMMCLRTWSSEKFIDGVLHHYAFGLIPVVTRELEGEGEGEGEGESEELVWKYPGFGETRMKRICKLPELNARALALPAAS